MVFKEEDGVKFVKSSWERLDDNTDRALGKGEIIEKIEEITARAWENVYSITSAKA